MAEHSDSSKIDHHSPHKKKTTSYLLLLTLSAIGVVYGDIGTSPLYAFRECFNGDLSIELSVPNVYGILSLIFWALIIIISFKYLIIILRADNDGEGGILALMELVRSKSKAAGLIMALGLFGAALLYGDGVITPAISVLSAVEGLGIVTHQFDPYIIPLTLLILFALFSLQKRGTGGVGRIFGPVTLVWFIVLAILGSVEIAQVPEILQAVNPVYAVQFFAENGFEGFVILGVIFLVVTGGEALYADMGHFGRFPIRLAWFTVALPSLLLNYFGQGALLISHPEFIENPFYYLAPEWALIPMVILATCATVIASQAVISGAFSLTFQALQLGYLPRMRVLHTSEEERGQIYIPKINWMLFVCTALLILAFKTSGNLAAAYGIAVTSTMAITTLLAFSAMRNIWKWSLFIAIPLTIFFFVIDISFFGANILKFFDGGWVPLLIGFVIFIIMETWFHMRKYVGEKIKGDTLPIQEIIPDVLSIRQVAIPGTGIYMWSNPRGIPPALLINLKHNKILHKQIVILTLKSDVVPHVKFEDSFQIEELAEGFHRVVVTHGFKDSADVPRIVEHLRSRGMNIDIEKTSFFLGRETLLLEGKSTYKNWRKRLFVALYSNAESATKYFNIPADQVMEVGVQFRL
ncbi:MAG: potassium transporter Kup [Ignavibacteriae bacterium]|nr:potassium transporter Kup [Ignavibacteriota bacterium]MCB9243844.1 potassium transporter Kup [Ignavibacteriales bacterium]